MPTRMKAADDGKSTKPERIVACALCRRFFAVSMRCTVSWSMPCVAIVTKVLPITAAQIVYSSERTSCHPRAETLPIEPRRRVEEHRFRDVLTDRRPAAGDLSEQKRNRERERRDEHADLDEIRPDDRANAADRRVERRQQRHEHDRAGEEPELFSTASTGAPRHSSTRARG